MKEYLMQEDSGNGNSNIYIIKDMLPSITIEEEKNNIRDATDYDCNGGAPSLSCYEVTFEEVFRQGVLNVGAR